MPTAARKGSCARALIPWLLPRPASTGSVHGQRVIVTGAEDEEFAVRCPASVDGRSEACEHPERGACVDRFRHANGVLAWPERLAGRGPFDWCPVRSSEGPTWGWPATS